jgi:class 3 adenylate cyclase/TolB-like protein
MDIPSVERRLGAILVADVVGFSRHMERSESATFARLRELRHEVIDPGLTRHGGRLVKSTGDGVLIEFGSALSALRAAVEIQREAYARNLLLSPEERFEFRIGINLGDIIVDGSDIAGDGVNVAARLESLALPGGICISAAVREQVHEDLDASFVDLGDQHVKNIARPIRAFRVLLGAADAPEVAKRRSWTASRRTWGLVTGLVIVAACSVIVWQYTRPDSGVEAAARPSLSAAVMPFTVSGGDATELALAETIARDVAAEMKRTGRYAHIAPTALTAVYAGKRPDPRVVGRELNVRYLVEGELRRSGTQVFAMTTLIETTQGLQAWSGRSEVEAATLSGGQGQHAWVMQLARDVRVAMYRAEGSRLLSNPEHAVTPGELCLLGAFVAGQEPNYLHGVRVARKHYDRALKLDPNNACALTSMAETLDAEMWAEPQSDIERLLPQLDDLTQRALSADPQSAYVWMYRGISLAWQRRWESALEAYRRAEELEPFYPWPVAWQAWFMLTRGQPHAAIDLADRTLRMERSLSSPALYALRFQCEAFLILGRVDEAIAACNRSLSGLDRWETRMLLASAHARSGNMDEAESHRTALLKQWPRFSVAAYEAWLRRFNNERAYLEQREQAIIPGLRKAGLPGN